MNLYKSIIAIFLTSISSASYANLDNKNYHHGNNEIVIKSDSTATVKEVEKIINKEIIKLAEINISPKNINNVSHNKFDSFSIDSSGVRLNNRDSNATYIINEVVKGPSSLLSGNIDVIGNAAHVIIANPSGIICDNCGFNNTLSETLISGTVDHKKHLHSEIASYYINAVYRGDQTRKDGTVSFINTKGNSKKGGLFRQLTIISKGINIADKLASQRDLNFYNGQSIITHHTNGNLIEERLSRRPSETAALFKEKIYLRYLPTSEINADVNVNIYAKNSEIVNEGYISSHTLALSLKGNSQFINKQDIYTNNLALIKDTNSKFINDINGEIFYLLSENNYAKERSRVQALIDNGSIINLNKNAFRYLPTSKITIKD